jgi:hypothetical protein
MVAAASRSAESRRLAILFAAFVLGIQGRAEK